MWGQGDAFLGVKFQVYQLFAGRDLLSSMQMFSGRSISHSEELNIFFSLPLPFPLSFPPSQVALTSFRLNIQSTARRTLTAPRPATLPQHQSLAWEGCGLALTARMANPTGNPAVPRSRMEAPSLTISLPFRSRSYLTCTWAVPKIPPTWTSWANTALNTS